MAPRDDPSRRGGGWGSRNGGGRGGSNKNNGSTTPPMELAVIPTLPSAGDAAALLDRIKSEFLPIASKRGWNVLSVTEMCCCGDGLDYNKSGGRRRGGGGGGSRNMGRNDGVLGYNATAQYGGRMSHRIHLRLRRPRSHELLPYEDVAGTMGHELAHCGHQNHSAEFYELMEEVLEEHATIVAGGGGGGFGTRVGGGNYAQTFEGEGRSLGGGGRVGNLTNPAEARRKAIESAERRRAYGEASKGGPRAVGGKTAGPVGLNPREAAAMAAERRRRENRRKEAAALDSPWCVPCGDVIELTSDEEGEGGDWRDRGTGVGVGNKPASSAAGTASGKENRSRAARVSKPAAKKGSSSSSSSVSSAPSDSAIDLTGDDDDHDHDASATNKGRSAHGARKKKRHRVDGKSGCDRENRASGVDTAPWPCDTCTLLNPPLALACDACGKPRLSPEESEKAIAKVVRDDTIEEAKKKEVEESERTFGGFNIYGNGGRRTGTMDHLT